VLRSFRYRWPAYYKLNRRDWYLKFTRQRPMKLYNDSIIGISNCCVRSTEKMKIIVLCLINPFSIYLNNALQVRESLHRDFHTYLDLRDIFISFMHMYAKIHNARSKYGDYIDNYNTDVTRTLRT